MSLFHDITQQALDRYIANPSHALIITGSIGVGTRHAAEYVIDAMGVKQADIIKVEQEKTSITIDAIRMLYRLTKSARNKRCIVLIDNADLMGDDAQNAFLKLLEEPPSQVIFIMTTHLPARLLMTIRSRTAEIQMREVRNDQTEEFLAQFKLDHSRSQRILFLAAGRPAEATRLAANDDYYESAIAQVSAAKSFLESNAYDRLVQLKPVMTTRSEALSLLSMLRLLIMHSIMKRPATPQIENAEAIADTIESLHQNGNPRAQLLLLCQRLS